MAWLLRGLLIAGVLLAYVLVLTLPLPGVLSPAGHLRTVRAWVDARWAPSPISTDARWLELMGLGSAATLGIAVAGLLSRRKIVADHALDRTRLKEEAEQQRLGRELLRGRLSDWMERSYPITFRCDLDGHHIELHDRNALLDAEGRLTRYVDELPQPAHRAALRNWIDSARTGRPSETLEVLTFDEPSGARWLELRLRLEEDPVAGAFVYGLARDVTERKQREGETWVRAAIDAAWRSHSSLDTELVEVLRRLLDAAWCQLGEIWWIDEGFGVLRRGVVAHAGGDDLEAFARRTETRTFGKGLGLAGRVWADAAVVRLDELAGVPDPRCARLAEAGPFRSAVGFPIRTGDHMVGVLVLLASSAKLGLLGTDHLERIGDAIGHLVDHKRSARALLDNEARKNAMLESALDCVISIDDLGRIVEFNPAAEKTFRRSRSEVLGQPMVELLVPFEHRERQSEAFQRCLQPGSRFAGRRLESEGLRAEGERFPIEISITSIHVGDRPQFTAYLRDISDRKELDRLKDELVSTVSHELRTPLSSMRGFVELLLAREFPPSEQRRFLEIVDSEIKRLGRLIDNFLDLQRLESGILDYDLERLDLGDLIREATEMFAHASERHEYLLEVPEDDSFNVAGDADRLRQVLRNLLSNATKYSPDGGRVTVSATMDGDRVRVGIRDQGIGMDADTQRKLFTRFYRADSTTTRRIGGTGLGLALVKQIVEAHGGEVGVESEPGKGSEFFFRLPLAGDAP
jgi:PAS domain S-box-containing protein